MLYCWVYILNLIQVLMSDLDLQPHWLNCILYCHLLLKWSFVSTSQISTFNRKQLGEISCQQLFLNLRMSLQLHVNTSLPSLNMYVSKHRAAILLQINHSPVGAFLGTTEAVSFPFVYTGLVFVPIFDDLVENNDLVYYSTISFA